ncbi:carboxypeptidase-like regulatory domain-containing protein [Sphingobacterium chuzhouense]|uniref:Carboxypeptidase regulatory-like domain-containing protein n=1 Tax=Sphingobacterium chuzhouense TaxID=1742264 RepID=A0ABR7XVL8_9SPHI|nr:carboxypeptidase-like regulatory domain-containing protein [Sphingobacterium chuzhouense]MBD1423099.1 carboxypeptidase regulatory-like domain-containing protein [Sphingobacterium chuzhouense]
MKKLFIFLFVIFFLFGSKNGFTQERPAIPINTVVERVQKYFGVYPVEKVHLHFDKPYYAVGDTLWFKTYLQHNLFEYTPSKIIYVEMLTSKDSLIQTLRVPLTNNSGKGQLVLDPQFIAQDNYRFRAYTKWMANFDNAYFYNKIVPVGDAINKKLGAEITYTPDGNNKTKATIQFRNREGNLLGRRKLTWEAIDGWDAFSKGKGETDDMGRVTINLTIKDKEYLKKGRLNVKIDGDKLEPTLVGSYSLQHALWDADVQFFPEGGDLLAGVPKKLGFKAVSSTGKGLKIQGKIIDSKKKEIASFNDIAFGMGAIDFMPVAGESYKATISFENGEQRTYDLPEVKAEGINIVLHNEEDVSLQMGLIANDAYYEKMANQPFYVLGQSNGHLVYAAQATLKNSSVLINLPKDKLPNGIVQLSIMQPDGKLLSERLVFNQSQPLLNIGVKTDKTTYAKKESVRLTLQVPVTDSLKSNYSVSVIDDAKVPYNDDQELGILSNYLLTSDLKGYVEQPNYYFNEKNENRKEALNALLMTQGFRRFSYDDLIAEKLPQVQFMPEQGITLSGILRLNTGRPQPNGGLLLSIPSRNIRKDAYTDNQGRFAFENLVFPDSSKVTINARGNDNFRNLVINMDQTYFPGIDQGNPYASDNVQNIDQEMKAYLNNSKNEYRTSILIDEVQVTGVQRKTVTSKEFSSLSGLSMPEHRIEGERLSGCNVLTMCLTTMLTGITYDNQTLKYHITRNYNQGSRVPVQFFLDGMPIDEPALNSIIPSDIEAIEIFLRDELGTVSRVYQNDGVVSIMTKKKDQSKQPRMSLAEIESMLPKTNVIDMVPLGYVKERQFYAPKYDTPDSKNTNDYRTTIYWNPDVVLDGEGNATLNFYNGDGNGRYKVVVEGQDETGSAGRAVYYYNVK